MKTAPSFISKLIKLAALISVGVWSFFSTIAVSLLLLIILFAAIAAAGATADPYQFSFHQGDADSQNKLASIKIDGLILGERDKTGTFFELFSEYGVTYGYEVQEKLEYLADQDDVAGVILEIHSPGGTIFGTKAIIDGIDRYRNQTGKPVIAYIGSMAASGGYWVAAGADEIVADSGTMIGSIGVISGPFKYYDGVMSEQASSFGPEVVTTGGITTEYISAGNFKDLGNPYREMQPQERRVLQQSVNNEYAKFVEFVSKQRDISEQQIRAEIGALIYDETQAVALGLIDSQSNRYDAYSRLAEKAGFHGENFQILQEKGVQSFFELISAALTPKQNHQVASPAFCFESSVVLAFSGDINVLCRR